MWASRSSSIMVQTANCQDFQWVHTGFNVKTEIDADVNVANTFPDADERVMGGKGVGAIWEVVKWIKK